MGNDEINIYESNIYASFILVEMIINWSIRYISISFN